MMGLSGRGAAFLLSLCVALWLSGCSSKGASRAPVEDRGPGVAAPAPAAADPAAPGQRPLAGAENAGRPGYYTVKPGDTLIRIGLDTGQNWRDVARWNGLENPNLIEVGQVLRVVPPAATVVAVATAQGASAPAAAAGQSSAAPVVAAAPPAAAPPIRGRRHCMDLAGTWQRADGLR